MSMFVSEQNLSAGDYHIFRKNPSGPWHQVHTVHIGDPVISLNQSSINPAVIVGIVHGLTGGGDNQVLSSINNGASWVTHAPTPFSCVTPSNFIQSLALNDEGSKLFMVDADSNVWRSTDYGDSWSQIVSGSEPSPDASIWATGGYVWWVSASGIRRAGEDGSGLIAITADHSFMTVPLLFGSHFSSTLTLFDSVAGDPLAFLVISNATSTPIVTQVSISSASASDYLWSATPIGADRVISVVQDVSTNDLVVFLSTDAGGSWVETLRRAKPSGGHSTLLLGQSGGEQSIAVALDTPNIYCSNDGGLSWGAASIPSVAGFGTNAVFSGLVGAGSCGGQRVWGQVIG